MKRATFWLLTAFLAFIIGAAATSFIYLKFFYVRQPQPEISLPKTESDSGEIPSLTYCTLAENPEKYDGETVRLAAKLHIGIEGSWFSDDLCGADNGAIMSVKNNDIWKPIDKARANRKGEPWDTDVELVVVGTFKNVVYKDWCCLTTPFRFEVLSVEKASKTKK